MQGDLTINIYKYHSPYQDIKRGKKSISRFRKKYLTNSKPVYDFIKKSFMKLNMERYCLNQIKTIKTITTDFSEHYS